MPDPRRFRRPSLPLAILAVLVWIEITAWGWWRPGVATPLIEAVRAGVAWKLLVAALFITLVALLLRWDVGLGPVRPLRALRVLWPPLLVPALALAVSGAVGLPPAGTLVVLAANACLVGVSEEMAFRGVLFHALRGRMGLWAAVALSSVLFGAIHVLNGVTTGNVPAAGVQAVAATMTGVLLCAVMLRSGSIVSAMLLHALWDLSLLVLALSLAGPGPLPTTTELTLATAVVPLLLQAPLLAYALWLLRREAAAPGSAP